MNIRYKIQYVFLAAILLIIVGTLGYYFLIDINIINALYMTVITVSTVGFKEVGTHTTLSRLFTIFLILAGITIVFNAFSSLTTYMIEGEFRKYFRRRSMSGKIAQLSDHYILCGSGETGQSVIDQFNKRGASFVVIEKDETRVEELQNKGILALSGDATQENVLLQANIEKASGLVTALNNDADNVLTVLTARELNPDLYIVARAIEKNADVKLKRAGADNTISPNVLGGTRMASLLMRPTVVSFLDVITHAGEELLDLEDVVICKNSSLLGKTLKEANIPEKTGLIVLAFQNYDEEELQFNPGPDEVLRAGDKMLVLGKIEQIDKLREMACDFR